MTTAVQLRDITRDNFDAVACLEVHAHQREFLASNSYSIAEAGFNPALRPRAVYADGVPAGFILYAVPEPEDDEPGTYGIWRFMVDRRFQGNGVGRIAFALALDEIAANGDANKVFISYKQDNDIARRFYAGFGFEEDGTDPETLERVAVLDRRADAASRPASPGSHSA